MRPDDPSFRSQRLVLGLTQTKMKRSNLLLTHEAFPFDKMVSRILDPEMIGDMARIIKEALTGGYRVNLMNNLLFFPSGHEVGLFLAAENPGQRGRCRPPYPQDQKRGPQIFAWAAATGPL